MKKLLTIALSLCLFAITGNAQVSSTTKPTQRIHKDSLFKRSGHLIKDLNLTDEQKVQLQNSRKKTKEQKDAIQNDASLTSDQKTAKLRDLQKSQKASMNSVLTPDQQAKLKNERKDRQANNKGKKWDGKKRRTNSSIPSATTN